MVALAAMATWASWDRITKGLTYTGSQVRRAVARESIDPSALDLVSGDGGIEHRGFNGLGFLYSQRMAPGLVVDVIHDSPAQQSGLQAGDVIDSVNGTPLLTLQRLYRYVNAQTGEIVLAAERNGEPVSLTAEAGPVAFDNCAQCHARDPR